MGINNRHSFTLIEMVIVVGVLGFALPVLFAIIFMIIQQQGRIYALQEVKKQGDIAFYSMKATMRQYGKIVAANPTLYPFPTIMDACPIYTAPRPTPASVIYLYDRNMTLFSYELKSGKIASNSAQNNILNGYLTDDKVTISNVKFSCYRTNQFSPPIVSASFTVTKSGTDPFPASLDYTSRFQLKSY